jgi:hypothetical protein
MKSWLSSCPADPGRFCKAIPWIVHIGLILLVLAGCGESAEVESDGGTAAASGNVVEGVPSDSDQVSALADNPLLDSLVRPGDSMLVDLSALIDDGLLFESDMPMVGGWVRERGGLEHPDPRVLTLTYRQLLNHALTMDLSGDVDAGPFDCSDCSDSIYIFMPASKARIYFGPGKKSLQAMLSEALDGSKPPEKYRQPPYSLPIKNRETWKTTISSLFDESDDEFDIVLFGNALMVLSLRGDDISDYTYGDIVYALERVKEQPEFGIIQHYLEQLDEGLESRNESDSN